MVEVAQALLGRGHRLRIYDPALNLAALVGANRRVIDVKMPHLASLLVPTAAAAVGDAGLVIAAQKCLPAAELKALLTDRHVVLDVNGWRELAGSPARYVGFCW
jgi:GDP-mannose 6-dehydrogenase